MYVINVLCLRDEDKLLSSPGCCQGMPGNSCQNSLTRHNALQVMNTQTETKFIIWHVPLSK